MDGITLCVFLKVFADETHNTTAITVLSTSTTDGCEPMNNIDVIASQYVTDLTTHPLLCNTPIGSESSHAPTLWHHKWDVHSQNMLMLPIFQGWLAMFTYDNSTSKCGVNVKIYQFNREGLKIPVR